MRATSRGSPNSSVRMRSRSRSICSGVARTAEDEFRHRQGHLALAGEDHVGAGPAQAGMLAQVVRPGEDEDLGVQLPREPDRLGRAAIWTC